MAQASERLGKMADDGHAAITETREVIGGIRQLADSPREMVERFRRWTAAQACQMRGGAR